MITKKMIEQANKERQRSLMIGSAILISIGFFFMIFSLLEMSESPENFDNSAYDVLFGFGLIVGLYGVFTLPEKSK